MSQAAAQLKPRLPVFLTPAEAAAQLAWPLAGVFECLDDGRLRSVNLGRIGSPRAFHRISGESVAALQARTGRAPRARQTFPAARCKLLAEYPPSLMTAATVARFFSVSEKHIANMAASGALPAWNIAARNFTRAYWRFGRAQLSAWVQANLS